MKPLLTRLSELAHDENKLLYVYSVIAILVSFISCTDGGDFDVYLDAARKLNLKENIYAPPFIKGGLQYYYSPFFALVLAPFSKTIFLIEFVWLILSFFLLYRIKMIISNFLNKSHLTFRQNLIWFSLSLLLSLQFIMYDIALIQVTILLVWIVLESLNLIENDKQLLAGLILGVGITIKIMPVVMLPYLFYRGKFKVLATCAFVFIALLFLPALVIGWNFNSWLLSEWWKIINPSNKEHMFETGIGTHSVVAWLPVYLTPTEGDMPFQRSIFNLSHTTVEIIVNFVRLGFVAISIFFLRSKPFKQESNPTKLFWEGTYFMLLMPLLLPHQQKYNFLLALPMIVYILYFFISSNSLRKSASYRIAMVCFVLCMIFYSPIYGSDIIGGFLFRLTQHYRALTFATIFLIPIAMFCNPNKLAASFESDGDKKCKHLEPIDLNKVL